MVVEQHKAFPTPVRPDTTSQSEISPSDSLIKIITLGKSSLKDVADSLGGELNRSWATGWSEDPANCGDIKLHYPNAQRAEDCPLFCKAFTLRFGPDISSFIKPESGVSKDGPPKKASILL